MASKNPVTLLMFLLGLLHLATLDFTDAQVGVCYERNGSSLPPPSEVVALYKQHNIRRIRLYEPDPAILRALGGSDIEVMLGVPNKDLERIASSLHEANNWVETNVRNYPDVRFRYIVVGNKVSPSRPDTSRFVPYVLPAMRNIQATITAIISANAISIGGLLIVDNLPEPMPIMETMIRFLVENRAPLMVNIYPYFSIAENDAEINLDYALGTSQQGITLPGGLVYHNLFTLLLDSVYTALEKVPGGDSLEIVVSETGWPSAGGNLTSVEIARTYNTNLIRYIKNGTPKRPGKAIETYIYAMFDEDQKSPEVEKHWGLFFPNKQPKYPITFN